MMKINSQYGRLYKDITNHKHYLFSLLFIFFLILIYYFIAWPIVAYDTDLWYHLSGGRYFWLNGAIANDAFFSYITPPKSWYNYYWLFQVIVYKIFQWTGYYGLITLRCIFYFLTALFICLFFTNHFMDRSNRLIGLAIFICYPLALIGRELIIRPHLISYLLIIVFLYILECKRNWIWLLPIIGILWCNIHGIEYPVMILIVLSYLFEMFYHEFKKTSQHPDSDRKTKILLILTAYTVFFTPYIIELIKTPFNNAQYQHLYILELIPTEISKIFSFSIFPFSNLIRFFQNCLILISFGFFLICLCKRKLRVSHLFIFLASLVLLTKHRRFINEFILLSVPMIRFGISLVFKPIEYEHSLFSRIKPILMIITLIIIPYLTYSSYFNNRPEYPFSQLNLPTGIVKFLNNMDKSGAILNEPNKGGYFQWALNNKYKIYMDLQMSLFKDEDFAYVNNALHDENTFRSFIIKYNPSFISVSLGHAKFKEIVSKFGEFKPVFFDDSDLLYVNTRHYKKIGEEYELKSIDPYNYENIKYGKESEERLAAIFNEAMRIRNFHPSGGIANTILANILIANKRFEEAMLYADTAIHHYPNIANGYAVKADILFGLKRYEEAVEYYRTALDKLDKDSKKVRGGNLYRNLHASYIRIKEYKKAYKVLSEFVNPFDASSDYKDIYTLGMSAVAAGKSRDGIIFLKIAEMKLPPDDKEYAKKISDYLSSFDPEYRRIKSDKAETP